MAVSAETNGPSPAKVFRCQESPIVRGILQLRARHPIVLGIALTLSCLGLIAGIAAWGDFDERIRGPVLYPPNSTTCSAGWAACVGLLLVVMLQWVMKQWRYGRAARLLLVLGLSLCFALGVETVLQVQVRTLMMTRPHPVLHHELIPSSRQFGTNDVGCRGDDFPWHKPVGEFRILVVGDSSAYGWGVEVAERFSNQLETMLRERHPDWKVRVVNAAVPAYSSLTAARQIKLSFSDTDPDMIVVSVNNDVGTDDAPESAKTLPHASPLHLLAYRCVSFMALRKAVLNRAFPSPPSASAKPPQVPRVSEAEIRQSYHTLLTHTRARSILLSMPQRDVSPSSQVVRYKQLIEEIAATEGAYFVDCYREFRKAGRTGEAWFNDWVHPGAPGHRLIAEALLPVVETEIGRGRP